MLTPSDQPVSSRLNIEELDGDPSVWPYKLKVSNGSLTDNGDGTATLTVGTGSSSGGIPQLNSDPVAPAAESAWVLRSGSGISGGGKLRSFLGLSFPYVSVGTGGAFTYQLSYRTIEGTTKRVALT